MHERAFGSGLLRRSLGRLRGGTGARHLFENPALVGRVSLHGVDQVRYEVVSTLELRIHVGPRVLYGDAPGDEAVVRDHAGQQHEQYDDEDDDDGYHEFSPVTNESLLVA